MIDKTNKQKGNCGLGIAIFFLVETHILCYNLNKLFLLSFKEETYSNY